MIKKIDISFRPEPRYWDFGNFPREKKSWFIKVSPDFWKKFVQVRYDFEVLYKELHDLAYKKVK